MHVVQTQVDEFRVEARRGRCARWPERTGSRAHYLRDASAAPTAPYPRLQFGFRRMRSALLGCCGGPTAVHLFGCRRWRRRTLVRPSSRGSRCRRAPCPSGGRLRQPLPGRLPAPDRRSLVSDDLIAVELQRRGSVDATFADFLDPLVGEKRISLLQVGVELRAGLYGLDAAIGQPLQR